MTGLDLSYNELTSVPAALGGLTALETLSLDDNKLTGVPKEFGRLKVGRCMLTLGNPR